MNSNPSTLNASGDNSKKKPGKTPGTASWASGAGLRMVAAVGTAAAAFGAAWVSKATGGSTGGALAIAVVIVFGGGVFTQIISAMARRRDWEQQSQNWVASALDQVGMVVLAEDLNGVPVFVSGAPQSERPQSRAPMSIERHLNATGDTRFDAWRQDARRGVAINQIWTSNDDPARRYEIFASDRPEGGVLWALRALQSGVTAGLFSELDALRATLDFSTAGLFILLENGRFVFANETLATWLETSPAQLMDKDGSTFNDAVGARLDIAALGAHTTTVSLEGRGEQLLVRGRWMAASASDASPGRTVFCGVATKLSGGGLDNAVLFDQAPIAITMLDRNGRIAQSNEAFQTLVNSGNPQGQGLSDFVDSTQKDAVSVHLAAAMGRSVGPIEARLSGEKDLVVLMYAASIQMPDDEAGLIVYLIDSTRQKILEQQIAQSQKMQAVGQLAGGIAHDFNNLLTAMIGFCDLLLQRHRAGDQSFADIMQIKQNANRAARLVRQLLAFSRQQVLEPRPLDVTDALAELNNLLQRLLGGEVEMRMEHGRDLGMVKVDQGQFDQVIINLAVNARDAMPKGGVLSIRTERRRLDEPAPAQAEDMLAGEYIVITVEDTGTGIEQKDLERIFDPFFTTKDVGAGTGLGLSTVYGIIKQTGGHIVAENAKEGCGAVFTIYLKRLDDQAGAEVADHKVAPARDVTGGGKVLLVEDEDPVRLFCARALRSKGYKVIEARNGEAALEIIKTESFDLLITDMIMPKVNGATVIKSARETMRDLPVICISGYTDESVLNEIESLNRVLFLPKPFSLKQLAGKVKEALEI